MSEVLRGKNQPMSAKRVKKYFYFKNNLLISDTYINRCISSRKERPNLSFSITTYHFLIQTP